MKILFSSLKNLWQNMKVAAKDRVDLIMFLLFAVLSYFDLIGQGISGTAGFQTFYMFWLLIRLATLKREMKKAVLIK